MTLVAATILVYIRFEELRTVYGNCILHAATALLTNQICYFCHSFRNPSLSIFFLFLNLSAYCSFNCWISVMTFDVMWSLLKIKSREASEVRIKFWIYCLSVYTLTFIFEISIYYDYFHYTYFTNSNMFIIFLNIPKIYIPLISIIFLVVSGVKIFNLSRNAAYTENFELKLEVDRFWSCLQILMVTNAFKLVPIATNFDQGIGLFLLECVNLLTSIEVFFIFVLNTKVWRVIRQGNESLRFSNAMTFDNKENEAC
jgi:hypothetical protein